MDGRDGNGAALHCIRRKLPAFTIVRQRIQTQADIPDDGNPE
jgi:hypothetical protein